MHQSDREGLMQDPGAVPSRTLEDSLRWTQFGTRLFLDSVHGNVRDVLEGASGLPGWGRRHLIAHVSANADALGNLVRWAATGVETPMYASPEARAEGIERGVTMSIPELLTWCETAATTLATSVSQLTPDEWSTEVVTAQGRTVNATEIPWLRAREVCVHAIDLNLGVTFADLPDDFLEALAADVLVKRGEVPAAEGPLAERVAWLTGRPHALPAAVDIGPWL